MRRPRICGASAGISCAPRTLGHGEDGDEQRVHQTAAEQLGVRLSCREIAEHHLKQCLQIREIPARREHVACLVRDERVRAQAGHMQSPDPDTVASDLHIRPGYLVMHHAGVIHEQITGLDDGFLVVNEIFARAAADQDQFNGILVRVHDARMRARIRPDLADIEQLRLIFAGKDRLDLLFHKTLYIQAWLRHGSLSPLCAIFPVPV